MYQQVVMPKPWLVERGKQWPLWIGAVVFGAGLILADADRHSEGWSTSVGALLIWATLIAGAFVMARRIARRKGRSPGWAAVFVFIGGWITVFVYQCLSSRVVESDTEAQIREVKAQLQLVELRKELEAATI